MSNLQQLNCTICSADIEKYYDLSSDVLFHNRNILTHIATHPVGHRALTPGRAIIINNAVYRNAAAIILQPVSTTTSGTKASTSIDRHFYCFILVNTKHMGGDSTSTGTMLLGLTRQLKCVQGNPNHSFLPLERSPLPVTDVDVPSDSNCRTEVSVISLTDVAFVTRTSLKVYISVYYNSSG